MEKIIVQLINHMMYDKLHTLAIEYSVTTESLIILAIKRLIDDVEFLRNLRASMINVE